MASIQSSLDASSIRLLTERYAFRARSVAQLWLHDSESSKDAVQESFMRLLNRRETYQLQKPFSPWYFTILRNICMDMQRAAARRFRLHEQALREQEPQRTEALSERAKQVASALGGLKPKDREILELRIHQELDFSAIATILKCSEAAARKRALRAIATLRQKLVQKV